MVGEREGAAEALTRTAWEPSAEVRLMWHHRHGERITVAGPLSREEAVGHLVAERRAGETYGSARTDRGHSVTIAFSDEPASNPIAHENTGGRE